MIFRSFFIFVFIFVFTCGFLGCSRGFWDGMFEDDAAFSNIRRIALLKIEYQRTYQKLYAPKLYNAYSAILRKKGYVVVERLEVEEKIAEEGLNLDKVVEEEDYSVFLKFGFADAGMIVNLQENRMAPMSNTTILIEFATGEIIWHKTEIWEQYKTLAQIPLSEKLGNFFASFPYYFSK